MSDFFLFMQELDALKHLLDTCYCLMCFYLSHSVPVSNQVLTALAMDACLL